MYLRQVWFAVAGGVRMRATGDCGSGTHRPLSAGAQTRGTYQRWDDLVEWALSQGRAC